MQEAKEKREWEKKRAAKKSQHETSTATVVRPKLALESWGRSVMLMIRWIPLLAVLGCVAFGADFDGKWKAVFLGHESKLPKMVPYIVLDLKTSGGLLTGTAHAGNWPGDMQISEGAIKGDDFSFTVYSDRPWRAKGDGYEASGTPKLTFSGTLRNGVIEIKMTWDSVMLYGDKPEPTEYEMRAKRTTP